MGQTKDLMATNHYCYLPPEVIEIIFHFVLGRVLLTKKWRSDCRHILSNCALVCKTWLWPARRRLRSLYFKREYAVSIQPTLQELVALSEVFHSPLCTIDPGIIQVLTIRSTQKGDFVPLTTSLSTLDRISLPSLHTLSFVNVNPEFGKSSETTSSFAPTIRSKIKAIEFRGDSLCQPFESVVYATHLFPMTETLTAYNTSWDRRHNKRLHSFCPPQSLQKLDVDTLTFVYLVEWLIAKSGHSSISSLSVHDTTGMHNGPLVSRRLPLLLDLLGPNLKEFELCT